MNLPMSKEHKYPRYDSISNEGFYEGYCIDDGCYYAATVINLYNILVTHYDYSGAIEDVLDKAYEDELYYYSEWTDDDILEDD